MERMFLDSFNLWAACENLHGADRMPQYTYLRPHGLGEVLEVAALTVIQVHSGAVERAARDKVRVVDVSVAATNGDAERHA